MVGPGLTKLEAEILTLLMTHGEMYGLEMVEESERLKRGSIYVLLGRLQDKGYVDSRQEPKDPKSIGLPRRLYKVTGVGEHTLSAWDAYQLALSGVPA